MQPTKHLLLSLTIILTAAGCGGGSDSSGGGGSGSSNSSESSDTAEITTVSDQTDDSDTSKARTYTGSANVVLTADGFPPISGSSALKVVIDDSKVTLTVDGRRVTTTLNGDSFSASVPITESDGGITCDGTARIDGKVSGDTVSGDIGGSGNCSGNGVDTPVKLSGSFKATR